MYKFSKSSLDKLHTCREEIVTICYEIIKIMDITVICSFRDKIEQNQKYEQGLSKLKWPHSMHNTNPSLAVDLAPYPIDWSDRERFILMAGLVLGIAHQLDIKMRWGGDWNRNFIIKDEKFYDLCHFELVNEEQKQ